MATSASAGAAGAAPQLAAAPTTLNAAAGEVLRAVVRGPLGAADKLNRPMYYVRSTMGYVKTNYLGQRK